VREQGGHVLSEPIGQKQRRAVGRHDLRDVVDKMLGHRQGAIPNIERQQQFTLEDHGDPDPLGRAIQALKGRGFADLTLLDRAEQRKQLIELHLSDPYVVQEVLGEGAQLLRYLDEPLQHGIGINLEHPCCASDAQPFGSSRHYAHNEFDRCALAMKQRAEGLQKVTATGDAQPLPPLAPTGMAVGAQIPQSHPAPIRTIRMRTAMMRGIHLAFSATCGGNPWGWSSRRRACGGLQSLIGIESCFQ